MKSRLRDKDNPHRHCRLACTAAHIQLQAVTIDGAAKIETYTCTACGAVWQVPKVARPMFEIARPEVRF